VKTRQRISPKEGEKQLDNQERESRTDMVGPTTPQSGREQFTPLFQDESRWVGGNCASLQLKKVREKSVIKENSDKISDIQANHQKRKNDL